MNATYLLVGVIVGVAILAMFAKHNRYQGDWQVQGAALSFGAENFEPEANDEEPAETDEHSEGAEFKEHMAQEETPGAKITKWTPELEAEKKALQAKLAAPAAPPAVAEKFEVQDELEGFEGEDGDDMKMPYLGMEYASV